MGQIDFDSEGVYVRVIPLWMQLPCITFATRSDMMIALGWYRLHVSGTSARPSALLDLLWKGVKITQKDARLDSTRRWECPYEIVLTLERLYTVIFCTSST